MKTALLNKFHHTRGITLVEILVGAALLTMITVAVMAATRNFVELKERVIIETKALYLAEEGLETVRYMRDEDWTAFANLATSTPYYLTMSTTTLGVTTTPETIDAEYTRSFVIDSVYRNTADDDIASSTSGSVYEDAGSRFVTVSVYNQTVGTTSLSSMLANIFDI